jgi:hypothetical protein
VTFDPETSSNSNSAPFASGEFPNGVSGLATLDRQAASHRTPRSAFRLFGHPDLQQFFSLGFVRGLCSGLGLLDIWIGFWEAVHYHE